MNNLLKFKNELQDGDGFPYASEGFFMFSRRAAGQLQEQEFILELMNCSFGDVLLWQQVFKGLLHA